MYSYSRIKKGNTNKGIFLSPSVIISDLKATGLWGQVEGLIQKIATADLGTKASIKQSFAPMTGEYNNGKSRHTPKSTLEEAICCAITTTTVNKPTISFRSTDGKYTNTCIIPDIPLDQLQSFISLFRKMLLSNSSQSLFVGRVTKNRKEKRRYIYP